MLPADSHAALGPVQRAFRHRSSILRDDGGRAADGIDTSLALALLRHLPASIYVMDLDGRVTLANRAATAALDLGHPRHSRGRHWLQLWPGAEQHQLQKAFADALDGDSVELSLPLTDANGTGKICKVTLCPIEDASGCTAKILCIARPGGTS